MHIGLVAALGAAFMLAACGTTATYLTNEYGSAPRDGEVRLEDGSGWWIWVHKTKQKLIVSVDAAGAAQIGLASGLTFGGVNGAVPQPVFEKVAAQYLAEHKSGCRATKGYPIDRVYFEFDYECPPPAPATQPTIKRRR